ncbi:wsc domain containing protein [Diplodia corticola]|uniref:Wsc domain containing protein n=1 Tax=Diplodia corticola TaxID=236234 RepID=A0A1J9RA21_9PEZI|nr:wsc domain containing protein [Diplodia corticola]OJD37026.1 wsc domain containing protein [Diplodia corticola]
MAPISALFSAILLPALAFAQSSGSSSTTMSASASKTTAVTTSSSTSGTTTATSSTGYPSATLAVNQGSKGYEYAGCWNETIGYAQAGGVRALAGTINATDSMTPEVCFELCDGSQFAGLEYGRECYCSPYLSSLSTELPEGACGIPCKANETEACGGSWALSLYNRTSGAMSWGPGAAGTHAIWSAVVVAGVTVAAGFVMDL